MVNGNLNESSRQGHRHCGAARALQRVRSRVALELTKGYLERHAQRFRYDGATAGRRAHGWYAASTDANVELMGSLIWLRNRSRDLIRNNPYAARAMEELAGNVVGTGIVPKAKTGNTAIDKIIDAEWPFFADACDTPQRLDFYGMQTLTVRTMAESGEAIVRFRPRPADAGLRVPLQLQMLEADFLDQARTMGLVNGHVMEGVQFDEMGRRVAYWLFSYHPGGVLILNPRGGIVSQPVPADQIMHVYRVLRPGQVRGVPWLAPVMMALRDLDDYCDAERVRKKVEACVTAFVQQPEGVDGDPLGIAGTDPSSGLPVESFQPGMVEYLKPGQEIKFNNPPAAGGYREYKMTELQGIMAGIGLPYELGTGDMSQVNYSSWRGGMLGFRNTVEAFRWLTLIPLFAMPVWRRFIDTLILQGKIPQIRRQRSEDRIAQRAVDRAAIRIGRSGEGRGGGIERRPHGPQDLVRGRAGERLRPHHPACSRLHCSTSWWTNSKSSWIRTRATPRCAARSSRRQRRSGPRAAKRLPPSPRARVSRRSRKRTWAWSRICSSPACRARAAVSNPRPASIAAEDSTTRKDINEREPTGNRWASGGRQY